MHPAINKLLSIKWKLFGRRRAIIGNFWTVIHTLLATILIFAVPFQPYDKQFSPVKEQVWKIILAVVFFILTFCFWVQVFFILYQRKFFFSLTITVFTNKRACTFCMGFSRTKLLISILLICLSFFFFFQFLTNTLLGFYRYFGIFF